MENRKVETNTILACPQCGELGWYYDIVVHLFVTHDYGVTKLIEFAMAVDLSESAPSPDMACAAQCFRLKYFKGKSPYEEMGMIMESMLGQAAAQWSGRKS